MTARDQQGDERELRRLRLEQRRQQVPFHVMDPDAGQVPGISETPGHGGTDQQGPHQTRAAGVGNAVDRRTTAAPFDRFFQQGQYLTQVVARGELGHDTAVRRVQGDLAVQLVRQQAGLAVVDGGGSLVAGGFDAQNPHVVARCARGSDGRSPVSGRPVGGPDGATFAIPRRDL